MEENDQIDGRERKLIVRMNTLIMGRQEDIKAKIQRRLEIEDIMNRKQRAAPQSDNRSVE